MGPFNDEERSALMASMSIIHDSLELLPDVAQPVLHAAFAVLASALSFTLAANDAEFQLSKEAMAQSTELFGIAAQRTHDVIAEKGRSN